MAAAVVCICVGESSVNVQFSAGRSGANCSGRILQRQAALSKLSGRRRCCCNAAAAANNSDSRPDLWKSGAGYHPFEELSNAEKEDIDRLRAGKLNDGELARSIAEVNSNAILLAPALSKSTAVYGTEVMYLVDEHGDIYFELSDDNDMLHSLSLDPKCSFIVGFGELNELLTTDLLSTYENHLTVTDDIAEEEDGFDRLDSDDGEKTEGGDQEAESSPPLHDVHPMVFASKLSKVAHSNAIANIFKPSMRLVMTGTVRTVAEEEEPYARRIWEDRFLWEEDGSSGDEEAEEEEQVDDSSSDSEEDWSDSSQAETSLYKFEMHNIQLASDLGAHASVDVKDFKYSEADALAHAAPDIVKNLNSGGKKIKRALKNLCSRESGTEFEEVLVIGLDSLGMDVRAGRGIELKTMRFPFARRARCVDTAQLLVHQLLYPRSRHKK